MQREAGGHAGKPVAAHGVRLREHGCDLLCQQTQAGRAAGEIQRVDLLRAQAGLRDGDTRRVNDARQVTGDRINRFALGKHHRQVALHVAEVDTGVATFGHADLGGFGD